MCNIKTMFYNLVTTFCNNIWSFYLFQFSSLSLATFFHFGFIPTVFSITQYLVYYFWNFINFWIKSFYRRVIFFTILLAWNILFLEFATLAALSNFEKSLSAMSLLLGNPSNSASCRFAILLLVSLHNCQNHTFDHTAI